MRWWASLLSDDRGRTLRTGRSGTLVPTWGDGSGTGTGGTLHYPGEPLQLWMGQWSPAVHHQSSNWKELKTLLLTLQQFASRPRSETEGVTLFYFTDNSVTYYVTSSGASPSPGLHALVEEIQLLSLRLGCQLEVVHVPGVVMIDQGTDGLSRGIWLSTLHPERDQAELTAAVFAPLPVDMKLAAEYMQLHSLPGPAMLHHWLHPRGPHLFHHLSVWFPPPELARQCLIGILETWIEQPWTTSALLFIPRTLSRCWMGLSRHLLVLDTIYPQRSAMRQPPLLPIPVLVLYLAPHTPLPPPLRRMDAPPKPAGFRRHEREATRVRALHEED